MYWLEQGRQVAMAYPWCEKPLCSTNIYSTTSLVGFLTISSEWKCSICYSKENFMNAFVLKHAVEESQAVFMEELATAFREAWRVWPNENLSPLPE
jgi:hypothetical protein